MAPTDPIVIDLAPAVMALVKGFLYLAALSVFLDAGKWLTTPKEKR